MARLSIKLRILLLAAVPTVLLGVVLIVISVMSANDISQTSVEQQREALYQQKRQELDRLLEMAITAGKKASNQDQLKDILRNLRYDNGQNYFFVYNTDGVQVVSADDPSREGQNYYDSRSPEGRYLVREYIDAAKQGGGYVEYNWPKAGSSVASPKLAKAIKYPGTNWVIATGFYIDDLQTKLSELESELQSSTNKSAGFTVIVATVSLVVVIGLGLILARSIITPLNRAVEAMRNIASGEGDLTRRLDEDQVAELGALAQAFNTFASKVANTVEQLRGSVQTLATSSQQLSQIMEQADAGVKRQHDESEQVAVAMNEMSTTAQDVASSASNAAGATSEVERQVHEASQRIDNAISVVRGLEQNVNTGVDVISKVGSETKSIGGVLEVIGGIAEQTNLLALNAAIEAARAGEQGRGFAVVADEVRTLASRTAESTEEINQMISRLQNGAKEAVSAIDQIREGSDRTVAQTQEVDKSLKEIYEAVSTINNMNSQIATAAEEQTTVSESINENLHTIVSITQESVEGTNNARKIADNLSKLSGDIESLVGQYKTR
ncbi:methyl-accepting chemotaxis protein [Idiomarina loihiensis]|uniref:methyl-accepting chemotaxis protein n=1 Tax=Idiomarina loihiensis TaxID=135577 RepID=UPI0038518263